jgi:hypothetical protein
VTFGNVPFSITYNPHDTDPFSTADITIGDAAMGTNGHVIRWSTAAMVEFTIAVMPKSPDHLSLSTLFNANAVAPGKVPNYDIITLTRVMADGTTVVIKNVTITGGTPMMSLASSGNIKTPTFTFKCPPVAEIFIPQLN